MTQWSHKSNDEIRQAVDDKKALPDLVLKRYIFDAQAKMNQAHETLMINKMLNGGQAVEQDIYAFRGAISTLFGFIGEMAKDNGYANLNNVQRYKKSDYALMIDLRYFKDLDLDTLVRLSEYNLYILHRLGLGDLRIDNNDTDMGIETF